MTDKKYGRLIGASLGPGDPELITRRAWAVLNGDARWLYPVKKAEEKSYALSIVERGGIPVPADAVELVFPMTRDAEILTRAWANAAVQTVKLLAEGGEGPALRRPPSPRPAPPRPTLPRPPRPASPHPV